MYDGHNDGNPKTMERGRPAKAPLGVKILFGLATMSLVFSSGDVQSTFGLVGAFIGLLRVGLLYALLKMRSWAWTAYLALQVVVLLFFGFVALAGSPLGLLEAIFAVIVIVYLYSIRDLYRDSSASSSP